MWVRMAYYTCVFEEYECAQFLYSVDAVVCFVFTQCFSWMKQCINKCKISIKQKLFLNISITVEHICVYKTSFIAELTVFQIHEFTKITILLTLSQRNKEVIITTRDTTKIFLIIITNKDHLRLVMKISGGKLCGD